MKETKSPELGDNFIRWLKEQDDENHKLNSIHKKSYRVKPETQIAMDVLGRIRTVENTVCWINLKPINLRWVKLNIADLGGTDLSETDLRGADLTGAYLMGADLRGDNLTGAYLMGADLRVAVLTGADLSGANLIDAHLRGADLRGADLFKTNLNRANLHMADLRNAKGITATQFLKVKTLFEAIGIPADIEKELREKKPELFDQPNKD